MKKPRQTSPPETTPSPRILNPNGGWCWYQDDRVIVDHRTGSVLFTTVANIRGDDGEQRDADIDVTCAGMENENLTRTALGNLPTLGHGDDHNAAALWQRPDGRYLAVYTGHNYGMGGHGDDRRPDSFFRISLHPHDATAWGEQRVFTWPCNDPLGDGRNVVTYSNLHYLSAEGGEKGRLYNIARASGAVWQIATSDDWGESWTYRGILTLPPQGGRDYSNGYMKFSGNGVDRIDFITTEAHPRDYNNGIYHGYLQGGRTHDAAGRVVDPDLFSLEAPRPEAFTPVFAPRPVADGQPHHAWTVDLDRNPQGELYALFTTRHGTGLAPIHQTRERPGNDDHRLFFARFDGTAWSGCELAKMGHGLWDKEEDYTGLAVLDPADGRTVYISTPIDPRNGRHLPHHELFEGRADTEYRHWTWNAITTDSQSDQLRPQLALLDDNRALLLWLDGTYHSQHDYDQRVLGLQIPRNPPVP